MAKINKTNYESTGHFSLGKSQKDGIESTLKVIKSLYPQAELNEEERFDLEVRLTGAYQDSTFSPQVTIVAIFRKPFLSVKELVYISEGGMPSWKMANANGSCSTIQLSTILEHLEPVLGVKALAPHWFD